MPKSTETKIIDAIDKAIERLNHYKTCYTDGVISQKELCDFGVDTVFEAQTSFSYLRSR